LSTDKTRSLFQILRQFITTESAVTTWIESSWLFDCPPTVLNSINRLHKYPTICEDQHTFRELVQSFSNELIALNRYWADTLRKNPNEIWEPSITAYVKSNFWMNTDLAEVRTFEPPEPPSTNGGLLNHVPFVLIASQPSLCGSKVGTIRVWPSR